MPRIIQLLSHQNHLYALLDDGEVLQLRSRRKQCSIERYWGKANLPPLETPVTAGCESHASAKQSESRLFRRPTSIGSDGNYITQLGD